MLQEKDKKILSILQQNCKLSTKELASLVKSPISTVHTRIKRLEEKGFILGYRALVNAKLVDRGACAFVLIAFSPRENIPQREVAKKLAGLKDVQEVHIIAGEWDMLLKLKARNIDSVGRFVIDKLRAVRGIEKTLTCVVFESVKEATAVEV